MHAPPQAPFLPHKRLPICPQHWRGGSPLPGKNAAGAAVTLSCSKAAAALPWWCALRANCALAKARLLDMKRCCAFCYPVN